jgi:hypothetical protein
LSLDELYELQNDGEVNFKETHGGFTVITLTA